MCIYQKALRLIRERKVKATGTDGYYEVQGDHGIYNVYTDGSRITCDCQHHALHGTTKGDLCSHKLSVIYYVMKRLRIR